MVNRLAINIGELAISVPRNCIFYLVGAIGAVVLLWVIVKVVKRIRANRQQAKQSAIMAKREGEIRQEKIEQEEIERKEIRQAIDDSYCLHGIWLTIYRRIAEVGAANAVLIRRMVAQLAQGVPPSEQPLTLAGAEIILGLVSTDSSETEIGILSELLSDYVMEWMRIQSEKGEKATFNDPLSRATSQDYSRYQPLSEEFIRNYRG